MQFSYQVFGYMCESTQRGTCKWFKWCWNKIWVNFLTNVAIFSGMKSENVFGRSEKGMLVGSFGSVVLPKSSSVTPYRSLLDEQWCFCCTVSFGRSVKGLQGVALLHKNLSVDSEFGVVCSSFSMLQLLFGCTDVVVDPRSRTALSDRCGLDWGMDIKELLHWVIILLNQFFLSAVSQHHAADCLHLRLELLRVDMPDVLGGHRMLFSQRSWQAQKEKERLVVLWYGHVMDGCTVFSGDKPASWPRLWVGSSTIWAKLCSESKEKSLWTSGLVCISKWRLKSPMMTVLFLSVSVSSKTTQSPAKTFLSWAYFVYLGMAGRQQSDGLFSQLTNTSWQLQMRCKTCIKK